MRKQNGFPRTAIIVFSPHGNTLKVAGAVKEGFLSQGIEPTLIDLTGAPWHEIRGFAYSTLNDYDLLVLGSPVYAGRVIEPIETFLSGLPDTEAKLAAVFVTYGLISGNALFHAARLLSKKGYEILGAAKIVASHSMVFEDERDQFILRPSQEDLELATTFGLVLVDKTNHSGLKRMPMDMLKPKKSLAVRIFNKFMATRFGMALLPHVRFTRETCIQCGQCAESCPVNILTLDPYPTQVGDCIKCYNCVRICPTNACMTPRMRVFDMSHKIISRIYKEDPLSALFF
jgi:ferredoxin